MTHQLKSCDVTRRSFWGKQAVRARLALLMNRGRGRAIAARPARRCDRHAAGGRDVDRAASNMFVWRMKHALACLIVTAFLAASLGCGSANRQARSVGYSAASCPSPAMQPVSSPSCHGIRVVGAE